MRNTLEKDNTTRNFVLVCILLVALVLSVYWQVGNHEFISYDDTDYVTNNAHVASGITVEGVYWAFTSDGETTGNWHPVTWLTHMLDVELYGMNSGGHHITNLVFHIISALMLLAFLFRGTGSLWQSAFVAAMFAVHPLHVESVAWVAERKDVLSAFFCFLTLFFYSGYIEKRKAILYIMAIVSYMLGLMSKPMLVSLPVVMFLIDFWPLRRYSYADNKMRWRDNSGNSIIYEKIPFVACSLLTCIITIHTQARVITSLPLRLRIENILIAYSRYMGKTFWPHDLAILYPLHFSYHPWQVLGALILLLVASTGVIHARKRCPYLVVGWFWFVVTLVPVIGVIQVGTQAIADRYTYIPLTGLFIMFAWGGADLVDSLKYGRAILAILAGSIIAASTALTSHQLNYWRNSISLYTHTLQVTTDNYIIRNNLGMALLGDGNIGSAVHEFEESIRIKPRFTEAHLNLGVALAGAGNLDAAIKEFQEVLRRKPGDAKALTNLRIALAQKTKQNEDLKYQDKNFK